MELRSSPGLNLQHGFLHYIRHQQFVEADETRKSAEQRQRTVGSHLSTALRKKAPDQELYISPGLKQKPQSMMSGQILTLSSPDSDRVLCSLNMDNVDLAQFVAEAQPYIIKAIEDPGSLQQHELKEVAVVIVNRGWEDPSYYSTAAALCHYLVEKERQQQAESSLLPQYAMRRSIVEACQELLDQWDKMRCHGVQYWLALCRFLAECYKLIHINTLTLAALSDLLFRCLSQLAQPPCVHNFDEVELLSSVFLESGRDLHKDSGAKMEELLCLIRDAFLAAGTEPETRRMLLLLIELHASNWELSPSAKSFHFSM